MHNKKSGCASEFNLACVSFWHLKGIKYHVKAASMVVFFPLLDPLHARVTAKPRNLNIARGCQLSKTESRQHEGSFDIVKTNRQKLGTDIIRKLTIFR